MTAAGRSASGRRSAASASAGPGPAGPDPAGPDPAGPDPGGAGDPGPSAWSHRVPVVVLALLGLGVSTYLALFQYGVLGGPWDPFFGAAGSSQVLDSAFSRSLPVRDAALGAVAYAVETCLELAGGRHRWRDQPWLVGLLGLTAAGMALTGLALTLLQAAVVGAYCTLCLTSAAISVTVAVLVRPEVVAAVRRVRDRRDHGVPLRNALAPDVHR